ncbi:hypothetical protein AAC387_Pa06g0095 [Persea americana]
MALFSFHLFPSKTLLGTPFFSSSSKEPPFLSLSLSFKVSPSKAAMIKRTITMAILSESYKPLEECGGVVGIHGDPEASRLCILALHALQYRGQEGAGITVRNKNGSFHSINGVGLVSDVFNQQKQTPAGTSAIGYVRDSSSINAAQGQGPFNIGSFLRHLVFDPKMLHSADSMLFLTRFKLIAVRDPFGSRPLVMGRRHCNGALVFASERCALDLIEATFERQLNAGEALVVDDCTE